MKKEQESKERLNVFMDLAPDAVALFDSRLNLVEVNKIGLEMFPAGTKKEDVIGENIREIGTQRYEKYLGVLNNHRSQAGGMTYCNDVVETCSCLAYVIVTRDQRLFLRSTLRRLCEQYIVRRRHLCIHCIDMRCRSSWLTTSEIQWWNFILKTGKKLFIEDIVPIPEFGKRHSLWGLSKWMMVPE